MKICLFACHEKPLPGQWAEIIFDTRSFFCPIFDYHQGFIWCLCPDIFNEHAKFKSVCGQAFQAAKKGQSYLISHANYYQSFFWIKTYQDVLSVPIFLELPDDLLFGKIVPSTYFSHIYTWLSHFLACVQQIEQLGVVHRLISNKKEHTFQSMEQLNEHVGHSLEIIELQ